MLSDHDFIINKKNNLKKLFDAKAQNKVDKGIINLIDIINSSERYYTTSSCEGRIVLLEIPEIGDKRNAKFLGIWHREIDLKEYFEATKKANKGYIWLIAQSPILHVGANTISSADDLLKISISCGFKNSGLKSVGKNIIAEICSTERIDSPVGFNGKIFCEQEHSKLLIEIANNIIEKSSKKLKKLEESLKENLKSKK